MESLLVEQSFSPTKQIKNPKRKTQQNLNNNSNNNNNNPHYLYELARLSNNISRQASLNQNYAAAPEVMMHGGFFLNNHHAPYHHLSNPLLIPPMSLGVQQPPPLLPLPTASRRAFRSLPPPSVPRKTPTKTKSLPKKENKKDNLVQFNLAKAAEKSKETKQITAGKKDEIGPDLTQMLLADLDKYSESVFNLAPPPSSLPLPNFYLRQIQVKQQTPPRKLSNNADVAEEADGNSSDNLCKLLRLSSVEKVRRG